MRGVEHDVDLRNFGKTSTILVITNAFTTWSLCPAGEPPGHRSVRQAARAQERTRGCL